MTLFDFDPGLGIWTSRCAPKSSIEFTWKPDYPTLANGAKKGSHMNRKHDELIRVLPTELRAISKRLDRIEKMIDLSPPLEETVLDKGGGPPVRPICQCNGPPDRLGTWRENAKGWDCRLCGGFVTARSIRGMKDPNGTELVEES